MTREEAIKILSKDTSMETVNGLIYYAGFNKEKVVEKIQEAMEMGAKALEKQDVPDTNVGNKWIPCSERLPEERESMFKKFKGTSKWCEAMFEGISDDVNVTVEFEDGTRTTKVSHTLDGKWKCEKDYGIKMKVIAWQPQPEPYKEGET